MNLTRTQKLQIFYRYFNYRPKAVQTREEPIRTQEEPNQTENLQIAIGSKCLGPEIHGSEKKRPEPDPKTRTPKPNINPDLVTEKCIYLCSVLRAWSCTHVLFLSGFFS